MVLPAYSPFMRLGRVQFAAVLTVLASLLCVPAAVAQRGGGGRGGGMARGGTAMGGRGMVAARPSAAFRGGYGARPTAYGGRGRIAGRGAYGARYPVVRGYPYGYGLGWNDPGFYGGVYDPGSSVTAYPDALSPGGASDADSGVGPYAAPADPPRMRATPVQAAPAAEEAVTLIFKDGRPPMQVHNYALTRTMLYVTDARHRDIPVADLDMDATQKVNAEAGVSFQLPTPN